MDPQIVAAVIFVQLRNERREERRALVPKQADARIDRQNVVLIAGVEVINEWLGAHRERHNGCAVCFAERSQRRMLAEVHERRLKIEPIPDGLTHTAEGETVAEPLAVPVN